MLPSFHPYSKSNFAGGATKCQIPSGFSKSKIKSTNGAQIWTICTTKFRKWCSHFSTATVDRNWGGGQPNTSSPRNGFPKSKTESTNCAQFELFGLQSFRIGATYFASIVDSFVFFWGGGRPNSNSQEGFQNPKYCQQIALNLCYLCYKVVEWMLPSFRHYFRSKFGGAATKC